MVSRACFDILGWFDGSSEGEKTGKGGGDRGTGRILRWSSGVNMIRVLSHERLELFDGRRWNGRRAS